MIIQILSHVSANAKVEAHVFGEIKPFCVLCPNERGQKKLPLSVEGDKTTIK